MSFLIDGYNLLNATSIPGGSGPGNLERARRALLNFLVASIDADELKRTTIVFDAAHGPPGLPRTITVKGMTVRYAVNYEDADSLIEELILADHAPRRLTVVSSDHRVQRAARRRRARAIDSDKWVRQLLAARRDKSRQDEESPAKPAAPQTPEQVEYWLKEFESPE